MAIFLTGSTGYIGAHIAANLLDNHGAALNLLVRARDPHEAEVRMWQGLQLHMDFPRFYEHLQTRVRIFRGDITLPNFGLGRDDYDRLVHSTDSVIHCAASLNRKSEKACSERQSSRSARSRTTGAALPPLPRAAPLQPGQHGCRLWQAIE